MPTSVLVPQGHIFTSKVMVERRAFFSFKVFGKISSWTVSCRALAEIIVDTLLEYNAKFSGPIGALASHLERKGKLFMVVGSVGGGRHFNLK